MSSTSNSRAASTERLWIYCSTTAISTTTRHCLLISSPYTRTRNTKSTAKKRSPRTSIDFGRGSACSRKRGLWTLSTLTEQLWLGYPERRGCIPADTLTSHAHAVSDQKCLGPMIRFIRDCTTIRGACRTFLQETLPALRLVRLRLEREHRM